MTDLLLRQVEARAGAERPDSRSRGSSAMLQARDNCGRELSALDMHRGANVLISVALAFAGSSSNLTWHRK
jgi:hypothetical protein